MIPTCDIRIGDVRERLREIPKDSIQTVVTSPPYWGLRDYGTPPQSWADGWRGELGLEPTPEMFTEHMVEVFAEVCRVLKPDGTCWVNMGDCYAGSGLSGGKTPKVPGTFSFRGSQAKGRVHAPGLKAKDLVGQPWRIAFALQSAGWYLRQEIIWAKPNPMPESVSDRCTKSHEHLFLLTKAPNYYFDQEAILEECSPGTHARLSQNLAEQIGSARAHGPGGKTNGNMKAVARGLRGAPHGRHSLGDQIPEPQRRKLAPANSGIKNNSSFSEAMALMPLRRNKRSVWTVNTEGYSGAHYATFPRDLVRPCILAGSRPGDTVLDCFGGSGTVGSVALEYGRNAILIDLNPKNEALMRDRIAEHAGQGVLAV